MKATGANYSRVNPSFLKMLFLYICISCRINLSNAFHHHRQPWIRPNAQATAKFGKNINSSLLHMSNEEPPLTAFLDKASKTGIDNKRIQRNSLVITKYDVPDLGIFADQTYELQSIYMQGLSQGSETREGDNNGIVEKIELPDLDLSTDGGAKVPSGYKLYITLYSQMYHDNDKFGGRAVITTPEEVGLVSMKDEVVDSILVALPILSFWVGTCLTFSNWYTEKYGGSFMDAFFRT